MDKKVSKKVLGLVVISTFVFLGILIRLFILINTIYPNAAFYTRGSGSYSPVKTTYPANEEQLIFIFSLDGNPNPKQSFIPQAYAQSPATPLPGNTYTDSEKTVDAKIVHADSNTNTGINMHMIQKNSGNFEITVAKEKENAFKPGKYSVVVTVAKGGKTRDITQDFSWGVLAVNTNKSMYSENETARIDFAVLNEKGTTICDSKLELRIKNQELRIDEELSTDNGKIKQSGKCARDNITDTPDYTAYYQVQKKGTYQLTVTAYTKNGEYTIEDSISVIAIPGEKQSLPFDVERSGPTRINPIAPYSMKITIKANRDFTGEIVETVPDSFQILSSKSEIRNNVQNSNVINSKNGNRKMESRDKNNTHEIVWNVTLKKGEEMSIEYEFQAPRISPEIFLLGPLQFQSLVTDKQKTEKLISENRKPKTDNRTLFKEERSWQVASDGVSVFTQRAGMIQNDEDGSTMSDTTNVKIGQRLRVRIQVDTTSLATLSAALQFDKNSDGNWLYATTSASEIRPALSTVIYTKYKTGSQDSGVCDTGKIPGPGYIFEGRGVTDAIVFGNLTRNTCRELTFVVDTKNAIAGTIYRFRLFDIYAIGPLLGSTYPQITVVSTADNTTRYSKANAFSPATSSNDLVYFLDKPGYTNVSTNDTTYEVMQNIDSDGASDYDLAYPGTDDTAYFGSVSSAGDVNGDGYTDILVGAYLSNIAGSDRGRAYVFYGGSSMNGVYDVDLAYPGTDDTARFGFSVSSAGDVNGDGYSDVIAGANLSNIAGPDRGRAYVFYGGSSMNGVYDVDLAYPGTDDTANFGGFVSSAGDVNGDGYSDVVVGAYGSDIAGPDRGRAYVFYGASSMNGVSDIDLAYPETDDTAYFGIRVSSAGDVNGDGYSDVVVGASYSNIAGPDRGRAYVFYGASSMNGVYDVDLAYPGTDDTARFGNSVSSAGDVNGDGYSDVVVGAALSNIAGPDRGRAYVFYGASSMNGVYDVDLAYPGTDDSAIFSDSVSSAGDVNGDGYSDVVVGASQSNIAGPDRGRAYVFYGASSMNGVYDVDLAYPGTDDVAYFGNSVSSAGDVNGDGYSDVVVGAYGSDIAGSNRGRAYLYLMSYQMNGVFDKDLAYPGTDDGANFGIRVSSAGDVNGDGYSDVVVGAYGSDIAGSNRGRAYVFYGASGMNGVYDVDLAYPGTDDNAVFGYSASSAGDVNGDGYSDVIAGAYASDIAGLNRGRAYVFYGASSMNGVYDVDLAYPGTDNTANFGHDASSAGDVNGDGYSDVVVGAYLSDIAGADYGRAYIFYGASGMNGVYDVDLAYPGTDDGRLGTSASSAGDVNGDGYSDVIVGAYYSHIAGPERGRAYVFYGTSSMNGVYDVDLAYPGTDDSARFGIYVSSAGDVNGDGYSDVVVGAGQSDIAGADYGRAYIFYGASGMNGVYDVDLAYPGTDSAFFGPVSSAGDVNGDGYSDVIVGAYSSDIAGMNYGRAYIFYGASSMNGVYDVDLAYPGTDDASFGSPVSSAGDVNGDGYSDVVVGVYLSNIAGPDRGRVYVFLGGGTNEHPAFNFAKKITNCSALPSIGGIWRGQSSAAASSKNIFLQIYNVNSPGWELVSTNNNLAANTDGAVSGNKSAPLTDYCDSNSWTYWRVYQDTSTSTLKTNYLDVDISKTEINGINMQGVNIN